MSTRKTLALALLLGLSVLYLTKVLLPDREKQAGEQRAFLVAEENQIASIEVAQRSVEGQTDRYTIQQRFAAASEINAASKAPDPKPQQSSWSMPAIRGSVLDSNVIGEFVKTVRDLRVDEQLSDRELHADLSVYGLDKPALTIVVHQNKGESVEVAFGKKNEYLSKRYAKASGRSGVFLVSEAVFLGLNKSRNDVRSKNPIQFDINDVREALITSSQGRIKVSQPAVGEWRILEPRELPASTDAVAALLNALRGVTVSDFIEVGPDEYGKYGFGSPRVNIHLQMREGLETDQVAFSLANAAAKSGGPDELYLQVSGSDSLYKLASDPSPSLVKRLNDLRESAIVGLSVSSISSVVSAGNGITPTTIASSGLLWTINGKESDPMFVDQYMRDLTALKADDFPEDVPAGAFESPFLQLTITTKDAEKQTVTLTVGKELAQGVEEPLRYVKSSRSDTVYAIRDVEAKRLIPHEEALVAKETPSPEPTKEPTK